MCLALIYLALILEKKKLRFEMLKTEDEGVAMQLLQRRSIGLSLQPFPDLSPTMKRGNWKTFPAFPVSAGARRLEAPKSILRC